MTAIEWTHRPGTKGETWNPIAGCSIATTGCKRCYAMKMAARLSRMGVEHYVGLTEKVNGHDVWTGTVRLAPEHILLKPLKAKAPRTYFVNSMSDLFHADVPDDWIDRVFAVMALTPQHTFLVLTKRAGRMRGYVDGLKARLSWSQFGEISWSEQHDNVLEATQAMRKSWPLRNVWLGVSAERQQEADARIPDLLATPAAIRFVSAEPLLGAIDFKRIDVVASAPTEGRSQSWTNALTGWRLEDNGGHKHYDDGLDWVIVGGESGPGARPMHPDWARDIRDQCATSGVPFFFKQWGEFGPVELHAAHRAETSVVLADGRHLKGRAVLDHPEINGEIIGRFGKGRAGHLLDGREHFAWPSPLTTHDSPLTPSLQE